MLKCTGNILHRKNYFDYNCQKWCYLSFKRNIKNFIQQETGQGKKNSLIVLGFFYDDYDVIEQEWLHRFFMIWVIDLYFNKLMENIYMALVLFLVLIAIVPHLHSKILTMWLFYKSMEKNQSYYRCLFRKFLTEPYIYEDLLLLQY